MKQPSITNWVIGTFQKPLAKNPQNFNVAVYPTEQKENAVADLTEAGFKVTLENHNNSLKVEKVN